MLMCPGPFQAPAQLTNNTVVAVGSLVEHLAGVNTQGKSVDKSLVTNIISLVESSACALRFARIA